ncbi:hypothetical protein [Sulfurospirillum deleyianum]|uniref:Uncharacterized protein n=1 Tax=Sulfurospirillum deleyianum (strain ATCC 51133 / DSM 6946 / 5175) TaxID=525898 RepID=D1B3I0_SULD5|nr:hypothetical protein [Sulfurospirillum deleyianum]ACZ12650.1 conserved hypothetical protein [Sulfurospirillum deleyianum DSM 6946]
MIEALLGDETFHGMMKRHTREIVELLLQKGVHFSILTNISDVTFDPMLPESITQNFKPITMFFLAGYTFESTYIQEDMVYFEAGFGSDNFGSLVSVPLDGILQIVIEEVPLFINLSTPSKIAKKEPKEKGIKRSMEALMSNPENQKLIKK